MDLAVNNFSTGGGSFDFDIIMLGGGAVILLLLGVIGFGSAASARIVTVIVGLAMGGYAYYLNFMFTGSTYRMPIYAYILPVILIVTIVRSAVERRKAAATAAAPAPQAPAPPPTTDQAPTA